VKIGGSAIRIWCGVIAGTPEEVAEHARALYDAGAHRVEFGTPQGLTTRHELRCRRVVQLLRR